MKKLNNMMPSKSIKVWFYFSFNPEIDAQGILTPQEAIKIALENNFEIKIATQQQ
jgi:hypothetical protein